MLISVLASLVLCALAASLAALATAAGRLAASIRTFTFWRPRVLLAACVALSAAMLASCGGGGGDSTSSTTVATPTITSQPASVSVAAGSAASFAVTASGDGTLSYQWYKASAAISGATTASYSVANAAAADAGSYSVVVANSGGTITSSAATLTVTAASASVPAIITQPTSQTVTAGTTVTFSVAATGSGTLGYQWYKSSAAITGATAASYAITSVATGDAGSYYVAVSDNNGRTTSNTVSLTVNSTSAAACDTSYVNSVLSAISTFETALGTTLTASTQYSSSAYTAAQLRVYKTDWSNLPPGAINFGRPGITLSQLSTAGQIAAFNALAKTALGTSGYADFQGVLAADDYLGYTLNANGYGADLYHVAVVGTPSQTGAWTLMLGGHHMAFNLNFNQSCAYPTPHHIGVEPRTAFTANTHTNDNYYAAGSYQVLADKAAAMVAVFGSLNSTTLASAFLTGQTFSDILIGPVEANTGGYANVTTKFNAVAASSSRGVLVGSLSTAQQALVTAAITQFTADYDAGTSARLLADYQAGYAGTYVAWADATGTFNSSGPDVAANGTYMRIEGPRVWIEIAVQNGIVVQNQTHYHIMFRDKTYDYYNQLSN